MHDQLAEAAVKVVIKHYFESMSAGEKAELKALFVQEFRTVLEFPQGKDGEEPGISY